MTRNIVDKKLWCSKGLLSDSRFSQLQQATVMVGTGVFPSAVEITGSDCCRRNHFFHNPELPFTKSESGIIGKRFHSGTFVIHFFDFSPKSLNFCHRHTWKRTDEVETMETDGNMFPRFRR